MRNATHPHRILGRSGPANGADADSFVQHLGREIVSGVYAQDTRLPEEATMLKRYEVSRTKLREAYSKLTAKGLIVARPKVGTVVRPFSEWSMLDRDVLNWHLETRPAEDIAEELHVLRRMIEPEAAALAAQYRTEQHLKLIVSAYEDMRTSKDHRVDLVAADLRFHVGILSATNNHFIGVFSALIHAAMLSTFELSWRGAESTLIKEDRLVQHREVLDAIRDSDPEQARRRMARLLEDSIKDVSDS